ncbi:MAG: hypothetical protein AB1631_29800 [Acidobacteriota bacterium]
MATGGFKLFSEIVASSDDIRITVPTEAGERTFVFDRLGTPTYKRYQDIVTGRGGRRRGDSWKATIFLFEKCCKDIEGLTDEEKKWLEENQKTAKQVLLSDVDTYGVLIDMVVGRYLTIALPDTEEVSKSSSGS